MNHTMFYLMSWVREKLEKKHINNETRSTGGERRRRRRKTCLRLLSKQVRRPFEVCCFGAVNSLRTCVISECKASLDFFLLENAKYLLAAAQRLTAVQRITPPPMFMRLVFQKKQSVNNRFFFECILVYKQSRLHYHITRQVNSIKLINHVYVPLA